MHVDLEQIGILRYSATTATPGVEARRVASLSTAEMLVPYESEFRAKRVSHRYLTSLIGSWLRDLAYRWNPAAPPGVETLREAGLLALLDGGTAWPVFRHNAGVLAQHAA